MKTQQHSKLDIRHSAFIAIGTALLAAITLFATAPRAPAQTGPGYALSFNGTNAYVLVASTWTVPAGTDPYTIEAWIRPNSMGNYGIIGWGDYAATNAMNALSLRTNGLVNSWWGNDLVYTNTGLAGAWHHVAVTCNGTTWRILYLDGVLVASNTFSGTHSVSLPTSVSIGLVGSSNYFNGVIDEVRLWNQARAQAQIQTNRYTRLIGTETGLKAYWKFDEGSGTTAADAAAGNYNGGTLMNNPDWVRSTVPFTPEGVASNATAITTASARLNANVHAGNLPAKAWFQWGATVSYGTNTPPISVGPGLPADTNTLSFGIGSVVTNLTFNSTYHFRVVITNSVGTNYSTDAIFTTPPLPTGPGCALSFDGTNDYVAGGWVPLTNSSFTIEAWARRTSLDTDDIILGQGWYGDNVSVFFGFTHAPPNAFMFGFYDNDLITTNIYTDSDWHHWAGTYDAATKARRIYRDGVLVAADTALANFQGTGGPILIGENGWGSSKFHGDIDELRIWNGARSQAQIQACLGRPLAGNEPGLLAYWQFDECSGTLAADTTGHGYDGTLSSPAPTWVASTVHYGPFVLTLAATNLTTTGAALQGSVNSEGYATTARFEWGATTNYGTTTIATNAGSGTNTVAFSTNITSLASFQTYHFRAVANNSYGVSYGVDQSLWLGPPLVTTLPATDLTTNAATVNGSVIPSGPSAQAWFQWGLTTNYGSNTPPVALGSSGGPLAVTNRVQPLLSGYTYHYRSVATNSFGMALGGDLTFTGPVFGEFNSGLPGVYYGSVAWGDYDNDGDLDLLLTGYSASGEISKIYRNNGNGTFTDLGAGLPGVEGSSVAWGDYDNDGDLDILLTGYSSAAGGEISKIYRNNGNSTFTDINAGLPGVEVGSVAWCDYNNDGYPDILLTGYSSTAGGPISRIYRNNGNGTFTNVGAGLPGVYYGSVAWGDYNNDGYPDILLTGYSNGGPISSIYRNNGNGTFTDLNAGLPGVEAGSVAWGDYNNDGYLDILLTGYSSTFGDISRIYRNNGNGTFTDLNAGLPGVEESSAVWGDYDNDGYLDILLTGYSGSGPISKIYRNNGNGTFTELTTTSLPGVYYGSVAWADYDNDGRLDILFTGLDAGYNLVSHFFHNDWPVTNNAPGAPGNLTANVVGTNALLSWSVGGDPQTPALGLSYNLRVGTTPGGSNVVSPAAAANGFRRVPQLGNMQQNLSASLTGLKYGTNYYWSVQAVDTAFAGSAFASQGSFAVTLAPDAVSVSVGSVMGSSAVLEASVYPNGSATTAYFQWGATTSYGNTTGIQSLGSGTDPVSLRQTFSGLQPGTLYHYRIVISNANGITYGPDQTFYVDPTVLVGDVNGDGMVDQSELDAVLASYWPTSPWLYLTNTAGLGGTNVTFALTNSTEGAFSVWVSTNLMAWDYLGPATPRYEFTDTNAPAMPQRFYRLSWP